MSSGGGILGGVLNILGLGAPKAPNIPAPAIPAPPAPTTRTDTGASIVVGSDAVKNQRVSGGTTTKRATSASDFLGGLGRGSGLGI